MSNLSNLYHIDNWGNYSQLLFITLCNVRRVNNRRYTSTNPFGNLRRGCIIRAERALLSLKAHYPYRKSVVATLMHITTWYSFGARDPDHLLLESGRTSEPTNHSTNDGEKP